jgi:UDP-N-acetylmuramate dehydrogenase
MKVFRDQSLKDFNSFGVDETAAYFVKVSSIQELIEAVQLTIEPKIILGGGSNVLFSKNYEGLVILNAIPGIKVVNTQERFSTLEVGGGVVWHELVLWSIAHDLGGLENLSLIPGTVGAAPIQNIGAYGVEFEGVFKGLKAVDMKTGQMRRFDKKECDFGYRSSIFKRELKDNYAIASVQLRLTRVNHRLNTSYGSIRDYLAQHDIMQPTIADLSQAVIQIRRSKLPDPAILGNSGSFFKNPVVCPSTYESLVKELSSLPSYPQPDGQFKIPAAWLIERAGWKGYKKGDAGIYEKHALVLVNFGQATGRELVRLATAIQTSVNEKFGVLLEPEVNIL